MKHEPSRARSRDALPVVTAPHLLDYEISPREIEYSESSDALSIVRLTLSAVNSRAVAADVSQIEILLHAGPLKSSSALLTEQNAPLATVTPGPGTPWAVLSRGNGSWVALPLPPAENVGAGETLTFKISNVVVNEVSGVSDIRVFEHADDKREVLVPVQKTVPVSHGSEAPRILSFTAEPAAVALGGQVKISWTARDAVSGVLLPGGTPLPDPEQGCFALPISETTTFELALSGKGGQTNATATATVMPVQIDLFAAEPIAAVRAGSEVTLSFATSFATQVSIDQGVGIVSSKGQVVVRPTQTTIYTLKASGLQMQTRSVTVTIEQD